MGRILIKSALLQLLCLTVLNAETLWQQDQQQQQQQQQQQLSRKTNQEIIKNITDYLTSDLADDLRARVADALTAEGYVRHPLTRPSDDAKCPGPVRGPSCPPSKYRPLEGTCNNVRHPAWGTRGAPYLRLLKPQYDDGISLPRQSVGSHRLPSPSEVVRVVQRSRLLQGQPHEHVTSLLGVWGEMLLRDISETVNSDSVDCCSRKHAECDPEVSEVACRGYMRSAPVTEDSCNFQHREQMNLATSYLDASDIYGATDEAIQTLRTHDGGSVDVSACSRCSEKSGLGFLYATLLREHNRVVASLAKLNEHWDDDVLFEEARRIVIAQIQHITYNEMLPTVLGEAMVEGTELKLRDQGYYTSYSSSNHAGTYNGVAQSALRVFLSMIPQALVSNTTATSEDLLHALLSTPALEPSLMVATPLRAGWASSSALLIHTARDHGVPSYQRYLQHCAKSADNFTDLTSKMSVERVRLLETLYRQLADVDLLAGGILETPANGAIVGPMFACLLTEQFTKTRNSDRFWYENDIPPSSFHRDQIREIRKVTLAGLLCNNIQSLTEVQSQAFVQEDPYLNVRIVCQLQPTLDMTPWRQDNDAPHIPDEMIMQAFEKAEADLKERRSKEYKQWTKHGGVDPKSPMGTAAAFSKANKQALTIANTSILLEYTSEELINSLQSAGLRRRKRQTFGDLNRGNGLNFPSDLGDDFVDIGLQDVDIRPFVALPPEGTECDSIEDKSPCDPQSPFRTITGYCNNLRNPLMGKTLTTFARLLQPAYENGVSRPRLNSIAGGPLPSPRLVSTMVHADISNLHNRYSLMLMQFAQFLDHDITFTPVYRGFFASIPDCRSCDSPRTVHPECMPIPIPQGDHYYPTINQTSGDRMCLPFMRSLPGQQTLGAREQINQNSAFLDTSQVYGEHICQARELRSFNGRLNTTRHPIKGKDLLPQSPHHPECKAPSGYCFIAGDGRASEQVALTVIHTLYLREHNRLADGLRSLNPHWDDERLYQHGRRILSAVQQHIAYNEFLPRILGWNAVNLYELKLRPQGYYKGYNSKCNPAIVNEFAAAAFRIGHSLLRPHIPRMNQNYQTVDPPLLLRDGFFNPDAVYRADIIDEITRGLVSTPMENLDQFITGEITNHLFEDRRVPHSGVDLIALNIQRSRDHALRPYNDYRALCNLKRATSFEDLAREIPPEVIARLKRIYATVDDIDLFPGGMSERPLQGGLVGPTFACIIGIQFRQLRKCDRFWYENDNPSMRFTEAQLSEIRKMTLSKILCMNMDVNSDMQRSAFDQPSNFLNPRVPCHSMADINLSAWRESPQGCTIGGRAVAIGESGFPTPCTSCICTSEGTQCASLRVTDCTQLMREFSREAILRDDVCSAQCGFLLSGDASTPPGQLLADISFTTEIPLSLGPQRARSLLPQDLLPPPSRLRPPQGFGRFRPPPPSLASRFLG